MASNTVIQTNVLALNSHRNLGMTGNVKEKASQKLASGYKINSAADDAAGLAISEKMRAQIRGLDMAAKNAQDAISLIQTAEGGMQEIDNMLQRIRELTVAVSNDTNEHNKLGTGDRQKMQDEVTQLVQEIDSMAERVEFNKKKLINGDYAGSGGADSSTISRLREALKTADTNKTLATAAKTASATAYNAFTTDAATGELAKAMVSFFGDLGGAALPVAGTADATNNTITAPTFFNGAVEPGSGSTLAKLNSLYQAIGNAVNALSSAGTLGVTGNISNATATGNEELYAFQLFLKGNGITTTADLNSYAVAQDDVVQAAFKATAATINQILGTSIDSLTPTDATPFKRPDSMDFFRKLANEGGPLAHADIKALTDAAQRIVTAVDNLEKFMETGGEYDMAVKAFETFKATEKTMRDDFTSKVTAESVANSAYLVARANLERGIAQQNSSSNRGEGLYFQLGANANQSLQLTIGSVKSDVLGIGNGKGLSDIDFLKDSGASITNTLNSLDEALSYVTTERSKLGAAQNRLEYTINSLQISSENLSASESRIRDADMGKEMMSLTKANILQQAAISMLAQANQQPQSILQLLQ